MQTIFVVDDDAAVRKGLSLSLRERGYTVEVFESASQFLDQPCIDRPGCILLDVRMPRVSGPELQNRLDDLGVRLPIIFLSAHGDVALASQTLRKGAIDFLEKPYELAVLIDRIEEALAKDERLREAAAEADAIKSCFARLTNRECQVMELIVSGAANTTNREVADRLNISQRTVDTYRARLMEKMQARSLTHLVAMAKVCGIYRE